MKFINNYSNNKIINFYLYSNCKIVEYNFNSDWKKLCNIMFIIYYI